MNLITAQKTYATVENATKALDKALALAGLGRNETRWMIAVTPDGKRFVPVLVGIAYVRFAHAGIMVVS